MCCKLVAFIFLNLLYFLPAYSQTIFHVDSARDVIDKRTINVYNSKKRDAILNVNKYIDTLKQIWIIAGSVVTGMTTMAQLRSGDTIYPFGGGKYPAGIIVRGGKNIISIHLVNGKLKISSDVDDIDGRYIAKIRANKLIPSRDDYHLYVSDRYFELFDDYYIPVLQIELIKKSNAIYVGGVFNDDLGYTIISKSGMDSRHFPMPIQLMPQSKRDSIIYYYRKEAKADIKPIHEN